MVAVYILMGSVLVTFSIFLAMGLSHMNENHPDYNGDDLFDQDKIDKKKV